MLNKWTCGKAYIMDSHVRKRVEADLGLSVFCYGHCQLVVYVLETFFIVHDCVNMRTGHTWLMAGMRFRKGHTSNLFLFLYPSRICMADFASGKVCMTLSGTAFPFCVLYCSRSQKELLSNTNL